MTKLELKLHKILKLDSAFLKKHGIIVWRQSINSIVLLRVYFLLIK